MAVSGLKAHLLLKKNIDALLDARRQKRRELAFWCRRTESWLSQIFTDEERNIPLKYLDRIADFFGLAVYQLFQPGISPLLERRKGHERRQGGDRRVSGRRADLPTTPVRQIALTPEDEAMLAELHALSYEQYQQVMGWVAVARYGRSSAPDREPTAAPPPKASETAPSAPHRGRRRTHRQPTRRAE